MSVSITPAATAAPVVPFRSVAQRMSALERANKIRVYRARTVKVGLKDGTVGIFDAMDHPLCGSMSIRDLLMSVPGMGRTKVEATMQHAGISWRKTCEGITQRQREALATAMVDRHPHLTYKLRAENAESVLAGGSMEA
jgi:hypothetical protein